MMPAPKLANFLKASLLKSMIRPRMVGPRSRMVTTTDRPFFATMVTFDPRGSVRCAAVRGRRALNHDASPFSIAFGGSFFAGRTALVARGHAPARRQQRSATPSQGFLMHESLASGSRGVSLCRCLGMFAWRHSPAQVVADASLRFWTFHLPRVIVSLSKRKEAPEALTGHCPRQEDESRSDAL